MRDYAKIAPQFWIGNTGRKLHKAGAETTVVAAYLLSGPHANMLGLYYLPKLYLAHETGLSIEAATKGLQGAIEAGFCQYDEATDIVYVPEMARYQIAEQLAANDNRCKYVQREYDKLPENPFLGVFYEKYASAFHLKSSRANPASDTSPLQAPSKPLRSQEKEKEQEQEQEHDQETGAGKREERRSTRERETLRTLQAEIQLFGKVNGRRPNDRELLVICSKKNIPFEEGKWLLEE